MEKNEVTDPTVSTKGWEINPKDKVPHAGIYIWTNSAGDIRPMNGSAEHQAREEALRDGVDRPIKTAKVNLDG